MRSVCVHMAWGWGITVGPACWAKDAVQCGFNTAYPLSCSSCTRLWVQTAPIFYFLIFYFSQLFHVAWVQASELQASVKLRFLVQFPRGMGNSKLPLMDGCHTDNTQGTGSTQLHGCASREQRETAPSRCPFPAGETCSSFLDAAGHWEGKGVFRAAWGTVCIAMQFDLLTVTGACQWTGA